MKIKTVAQLGLVCVLLAFVGVVFASDPAPLPAGPPLLTASPLEAAPKLDESGSDPAWAKCIEARDMPLHTGRSWPANETSFRFGYTSNTLYGLIQCASRGAKPKVTVRDHDGVVCTDDAIELFLEPVVGSGKSYQFIANAVGARYEGLGPDKSWNGAWEAAASIKEGSWTLMVAIPFATLGIKPAPGMTLGFNLTRDDQLGNQLQSWADLGGGAFDNPSRFGRLALGGSAIGAAGLTSMQRDQDRAVAQGAVTNASGAAQKVSWLMAGTAGAETFRFDQTMDIPAAGSMPVEQKTAAIAPAGIVGWRSMLSAGGTPLYVSPAMSSPFLRLPVLARKLEPLVLSNEFVRLAFEANTGAPVSLRNLKTGQEMLASQTPGPLFRLDTVNYAKNPMFFREDDVLTLTPNLQSFRSAKIEEEVRGQRSDVSNQLSAIEHRHSALDKTQVLTVVHQFEEGITVTATIRLKAGDPVSQWEIAVSNALPRRPRDGVIVHRVAFPILNGLKAAEADEDQTATLPTVAGRLVRGPSKKLVEPARLQIPGWTSMSWLDLSGPSGGVYLASHDLRPVVQTILETKGESDGKVGLSITRWSVLWPGKSWKPQACSVGLHEGDWHWSADRYREWYYASVTPRATPEWVLAEDGWMFDGMEDRFTCQDLARRLTIGQNFGIHYVQSWQAPGHFNQNGILGWYLANVYGGTERDFKEAIGEIHRRGGRVGFYLDFGDMEANMGAIMHQPQYTQKLPADAIEHMPAADPLSDGWLESGVMNPDGSYKMGWPSGIDMWSGCLGSAKGWGPWYYYNVVTKHAREYKTDAWYADCHPGLSEGMCFSPNHAHKSPEALGQITLDFGERVARNVSKDFGMLGEGFCDRFFTYNTHALWCMFINMEDSEPAVFRYTHPRFPLFSGTSSYTWGAPSPLYTKLLGIDRVSFPDHLRYMLLYGIRFDICFGPIYVDSTGLSGDNKEMHDLVALRKSVHQDLEDADFRDQIGLTGVLPKTQARIFARRDRAGGLITIFDARQEKTAFPLSLKLAPHRLAAITGAEIFLPGGTRQAMPNPIAKGDEVVFQVPKIDARMLIVRFEAKPD